MSGLNFKKKYCSVFPGDLLYLYKSVDPDEMQHYAELQLGLCCLQKYSFRGFTNAKG